MASVTHVRPAQRARVLACEVTPARAEDGANSFVIVEHCGKQSRAQRVCRGSRIYVTDLTEGVCDIYETTAVTRSDSSGWTTPLQQSRSWDSAAGRDVDTDESLDASWLQWPGAEVFRKVMLPESWPRGVSEEFVGYACWNVLRNAFRKANYVLGTSALLYALGLGAEKSLGVSIALNWVLKDGLGMASKVVVSAQVSRVLDRDPKAWRMLGDSLMTLSVFVELLSPLQPSYFFFFGSLSSLLKSVADAMSGPSYRVFLQNFALADNIGDISSRSEIHVVVGTLLGLAVGAGASTLVSSDALVGLGVDRGTCLGALFCTFAAGHLFSCRQEIRMVELRTLNWKRLSLILEHFLSQGSVPSISSVNAEEKLASNPWKQQRVIFGAQLIDFVDSGADARNAIENRSDRYILARRKDGCIGIMLEESADAGDVLQAALHAQCVLQRDGAALPGEAADDANLGVHEIFPVFESELARAGWTPRILFDTGTVRYRQADISSAPKVIDRT